MDVATIIGSVTAFITLLVLIGGGFYWWGRLSNRVDNLSDRMAVVEGDVNSLRGEVSSLRDDVNAVRGEVRATRDELLGEIRRSEGRILAALMNHAHVAPDAGRPVFWFPPGAEPPAPGNPGEMSVGA